MRYRSRIITTPSSNARLPLDEALDDNPVVQDMPVELESDSVWLSEDLRVLAQRLSLRGLLPVRLRCHTNGTQIRVSPRAGYGLTTLAA